MASAMDRTGNRRKIPDNASTDDPGGKKPRSDPTTQLQHYQSNRRKIPGNTSTDDPRGKKPRFDLTTQLLEYESGGGLKDSTHGDIYQLKLLMLFLHRGMGSGYTFKLATEKKGFGAFDDVLFEYGGKYICLQAKHKQDDKEKISSSDLFPPRKEDKSDGNFAIQKYFLSYLQAKQCCNKNNMELEHIIICTNIGFGFEGGKTLPKRKKGELPFSFDEVEMDTDRYKNLKHLLYVDCGKTTGIYKFSARQEDGVIKTMLDLSNLPSSKKKQLEQCNLTEAKIEEEKSNFLDIFLFAVDQANEIELGECLLKELGTEFKLSDPVLLYDHFQAIVLDWFKEKKGTYQTAERGSEFFEEAKNNLFKLILIFPKVEYHNMIKNLNIKFEEHLIEASDRFLKSEKKVFFLYCEHTLMSVIKVFQVLQGKSEYRNRDGYNFIRLSSLLRTKKYVIGALKQRNSNLLVIECNPEAQNIDVKKLGEALSEIQSLCSDKKIVLITRNECPLAERFKVENKDNYEEGRDQYCFEDLTEQSQNVLLERKVTFQNEQLSFNELIDEESKKFIDSDTLLELINKDTITIGTWAGEMNRTECYVERYFIRQTLLDKSVFEATSDCFAVRDNDTVSLENIVPKGSGICLFREADPVQDDPARFFILDNEATEQQFEKLCLKYDDHIIHWITFNQSDEPVWHKSGGAVSKLHGYISRDQNSIERYSENELLNQAKRKKVIIISDIAGMGKSTVLSKLAHKMKRESPHLWVVRINLNDCTKVLLDELNHRSSKTPNLDCNNNDKVEMQKSAIDFLMRLLDSVERTKLKTVLEKRLFEHSFKHPGRIAVLFDGFDEICPDYGNIIIDLLVILKCTQVETLWVTTRPNMEALLEDELFVLPHSLEPFSKRNQTNFVQKRLNYSSRNEAENMIRKFYRTIGEANREFLSIPLHAGMLVVIYESDPQSHPPTKLPIKYGDCALIDLYKKFIESKYHIYLKEKSKTNEDNLSQKSFIKRALDSLSRYQVYLASTMLFKNEDAVSCLIEDPEPDESTLQETPKIGIVKGIGDGVEFIHRTFAEYIVAEFLADRLKKGRKDTEFHEFLIADILLCPGYKTIRTFLNGLLENNTPCDGALINLGKQLYSIYRIGEKHDEQKTTVMHRAVEEGKDNILKVLLDSLNKHGDKLKEFFGTLFDNVLFICIVFYSSEKWNKMYTSDEVRNHYLLTTYNGIPCRSIGDSNHLRTRRIILSDNTVRYISQLFIKTGARVDVENNEYKTVLLEAARSNRWDVVQYLMNEGVKVNAKTSHGETVLHYATIFKKLNIVKDLIEKGVEVDAETRDGMTALHYATRLSDFDPTEVLRDEDCMLDVLKFLIDNGAEVNAKCKYGKTVLHYASKAGLSDAVKLLIDNRADVNAKTKSGKTALHYAAKQNKWDTAKLLIENGADVNVKTNNGKTVLHLAVGRGILDFVKFLMGKGADVDDKSGDGKTALYYAAGQNKCQTVKLFIENMVEVDARGKDGMTALHYAARGGKLDVVKLLIENGVEVDATGQYGMTALHYAVESIILNEQVLFINEAGDDVSAETEDRIRALHYAARRGESHVLKLLLERGVKIDAEAEDGMAARYYAVKRGVLDVLELLIEKGAKIDARAENGMTALHYAARRGVLDVLKLLIKKGAEIDAEAEDRMTALHYAAERDITDAVELLIDHGADINARGEYGRTALHCAALEDRLDVLKLLIEKGAKIDARAEDGMAALHYAAERNKWDTVKLLIYHGADINAKGNYGKTVLHCAAKGGVLDVLELLIEKGAKIDAKDEDGMTSLYYVALTGVLGALKLLIEKGAMIDTKAEDGKTALHYAAENDMTDAVELLINYEADINAKSWNGLTALHYAAMGGRLDLIELLIEKGAKIDAKDMNGMTALHCADGHGMTDAVELLITHGADFDARIRCES